MVEYLAIAAAILTGIALVKTTLEARVGSTGEGDRPGSIIGVVLEQLKLVEVDHAKPSRTADDLL